MNEGNNETDNILRQSSNDSMKSSTTENEYNKWENNQHKIEKPDNTENMIKINKMKQNIIRKFANVTNTDMKDIAPLRIWTMIKNNQIHIKLLNYTIEDLQDFKLNLLKEMIYVTTTVISPVTITNKQNSFK